MRDPRSKPPCQTTVCIPPSACSQSWSVISPANTVSSSSAGPGEHRFVEPGGVTTCSRNPPTCDYSPSDATEDGNIVSEISRALQRVARMTALTIAVPDESWNNPLRAKGGGPRRHPPHGRVDAGVLASGSGVEAPADPPSTRTRWKPGER